MDVRQRGGSVLHPQLLSSGFCSSNPLLIYIAPLVFPLSSVKYCNLFLSSLCPVEHHYQVSTEPGQSSTFIFFLSTSLKDTLTPLQLTSPVKNSTPDTYSGGRQSPIIFAAQYPFQKRHNIWSIFFSPLILNWRKFLVHCTVLPHNPLTSAAL